VRALYKQMARINITSLWAKLLDFPEAISDTNREIDPFGRADELVSKKGLAITLRMPMHG